MPLLIAVVVPIARATNNLPGNRVDRMVPHVSPHSHAGSVYSARRIKRDMFACLAAFRRRSFPGGAVDALAEQVGVAIVPGVLLDHVGEDVAERERLAVVAARDVE